MRGPGIPSIDQLLVLLAVDEEGSFTAAARRLGRATSAISYAIDTLEQQLGLSLFDRGTTRKARLTREGEAILSEAKAVAFSVETLRARVRGFLDHLEPELSLVVDAMYPLDRLSALLRRFNDQFPTVPVRLLVETLGGVERAVRNGHAVIGIGNPLHMNMTGMRQTAMEGVPMIPVAAPGHPLARAAGSTREASDYIQLILSERQSADRRDYGVVSLNSWRIEDLGAKHALLLAGLGWGGMPEPTVHADLDSGRLVKLNLRNWRGIEYVLLVFHKTETPPGPAGRWLIDELAATN